MIGTGELIVILCLALLLFGGKKLPELARSLGLGIREFKKACNGLDDECQNHSTKEKKQAEPVTIIVEPENKDD
jgi:sec-independent protein translocase protein TatA